MAHIRVRPKPDRKRSSPKPKIVISARVDSKTKQRLVRISKRKKHRNLSDTVELAVRQYINDNEEAE